MSSKQMIREEEVQLGGDETQGTVLMTVGKLLLWTDLIFLSFLYSGVKGGSYLYLYWTVVQALIGCSLLAIGRYKRGSLTH
ncbi:MAG: hypothetical protein JO356_13210 [Acidobacteria bacterium]|nr:hypothetical protein [Acidobacteriota bacterium]